LRTRARVEERPVIEIGTELRRSLRMAEPASDVRMPSLAATLDELSTKGYVVVEHLVADELIDEVCEELESWFAATPPCQGDLCEGTTRLESVLVKSRASHALVLNELVLSIMHEVLGPHCDWFQLNLAQAMRAHPGERSAVPHRDEEIWPCAKNGVEYVVNVMWALSDFTAGNGATLLWPRGHCAAPTRSDVASAVAATMPRGSALIYLGSITHCAGANRSNSPRTGLLLSYCLGWLKQYENAFLAYPPAIAKQFPAGIRDLLGYRIHRPNLGGYERQDPAALFELSSRSLASVDALASATALGPCEYYDARSAK
jgi:ectoine hydroxylase-related dioxygenase (phytanoyl-CoA dioxygenase family)